MGLAGWPTYTNGGKLLVGAQFTRAANPMLGRTIACRTALTQTLQTKIDNVNFVCRLQILVQVTVNPYKQDFHAHLVVIKI